jgi:SAM-dependent methyltransferase
LCDHTAGNESGDDIEGRIRGRLTNHPRILPFPIKGQGVDLLGDRQGSEHGDAVRRTYYESDDARRHLSGWYNDEKEEAFIAFLFQGLTVPSTGLIVEVGGGAATHARILARRFGSRYLFTDISTNLVDFAAKSGLAARQMDGLAMTLGDGSAACAILVATSTLLYGSDLRKRQFEGCARILRPEGIGIFVTSRWDRRYHVYDQDDVRFLSALGFSATLRTWGIIPGRLWRPGNKRVFSAIEAIAARSRFSGRVVLIAKRRF